MYMYMHENMSTFQCKYYTLTFYDHGDIFHKLVRFPQPGVDRMLLVCVPSEPFLSVSGASVCVWGF